jgi:hypothetical protein
MPGFVMLNMVDFIPYCIPFTLSAEKAFFFLKYVAQSWERAEGDICILGSNVSILLLAYTELYTGLLALLLDYQIFQASMSC